MTVRILRNINRVLGRGAASPFKEGVVIMGNLSGNIHIALAALGAAIGIGMIGMSAVAAVGRNPGASNKIMVLGILMAALAEAIFFVALLLGKTFGG